MPRYEHREISFDYPREWEDRSIVAFAATGGSSQSMIANLVMTRDRLEGPGDTLKAYADRQLVELVKRLDAFQLHGRDDLTLDEHRAVEIRFGWNGSSGPLVQRLVLVANRKGTVFSFTATMAKGEAAEYAPIFERMLKSLKVHDG